MDYPTQCAFSRVHDVILRTVAALGRGEECFSAATQAARRALRSLSILSLVMTTFDGSTPTFTVAPAAGRWSRHLSEALPALVRRREWALTVDLLPSDALDVDDPLAAVHLDDLAVAPLEVAPDNLHLIVAADRHGVHLRDAKAQSIV